MYVDDLLVLSTPPFQEAFYQALVKVREIGSWSHLSESAALTFPGLEIQLTAPQTLTVHQRPFMEKVLQAHGWDLRKANGRQCVVIGAAS